jgi:membrane protease YdiL (CAAX protease family)
MRQLTVFFSLSYIISWIVWLPLYGPAIGLTGLPLLPFHHALGAYGPILAAIITRGIYDRQSLKNFFASFYKTGSGLMLLIALLAPFALMLIGIIISGNGASFDLRTIGQSDEFPQWEFSAFFIYNLITFGYGEEAGWRGYALPELQKRFNALNASLILTVFWAIWHWPLFLYRQGYTQMDIAGAAGWILSLLTGSVLLTWLYNSSRGSILVCAIFHATVDIAFTSKAIDNQTMSYMGMMITIWGMIIVLLKKPKNLSSLPRYIQ